MECCSMIYFYISCKKNILKSYSIKSMKVKALKHLQDNQCTRKHLTTYFNHSNQILFNSMLLIHSLL